MTSIPIRENTINAAVNALYKNVGSEKINASEPIKKLADFDGDGAISKDELKRAIKEDKLALSLKEYKSGGIDGVVRLFKSADVAIDVVDSMDGSDGHSDGRISVAKGVSASSIEFADALIEGKVVIGSQLMDKEDTKLKGIKVVELHQNQDGPKLVSGR